MSPPTKKLKFQQKNIISELAAFQNEIRKIKGEPVVVEEPEPVEEEVQANIDPEPKEEENIDYLEDPFITTQQQNNDEIKKYIRMSERRINDRLERIEQKLNKLLERQVDAQQIIEEEPAIEEQHLIEYEDSRVNPGDLDNRLFPVSDEATFDWFFDNLKEEEYRNNLIARRWPLTRNVNTKTLNIAVKEYLRMHFELTVCVKYSCSGYGSHGTKKKKLDTKTLSVYVFESFNNGFPGIYSYSDISKAIVLFWGRAPDTLNKQNERAIKREIL
jgi:hypothetical protein